MDSRSVDAVLSPIGEAAMTARSKEEQKRLDRMWARDRHRARAATIWRAYEARTRSAQVERRHQIEESMAKYNAELAALDAIDSTEEASQPQPPQ